jgi:hypothetical protein
MPSLERAYKFRNEIAHERRKAKVRGFLAYFEWGLAIAVLVVFVKATMEYMQEQAAVGEIGGSALPSGAGWFELGGSE